MTLLKFMLAGLVLTAVSAFVAYSLWGEDVALGTALTIGIITQHGSLFAAAFGWPHYGFWHD